MADDGGFQRVEATDGFKRVDPAKSTAGFTRVEDKPEEPGTFDYMGWLGKHASEGWKQFREGMHRDGPGLSAHDITGPFQAGAGLFKIATSPISAAGSVIDKSAERGLDTVMPPRDPRAPQGGVAPSDALNVLGFRGMKAAPKLPSLPKLENTAIEKILSPTTVSADAGKAEASIRGSYGNAARETETTRTGLIDNRAPFGQRAAAAGKELAGGNFKAAANAFFDSHSRMINSMPDADRVSFLDYVENRSKGWNIPDKATQPLADKLRDAYELRKAKISSLSSTQNAHFIEDYFVHLWEDPKAAAKVFAGGPAKQGTGRFLKQRSIPTISDGLKQGLKLKTTDPIAATMEYVENMDRFIAANEVVDEARAAGTVKYFKPGSRNVPDGWIPIAGRLSEKSTRVGKMVAHAPEDWARVYNNFISRGFHSMEIGGRDVGPIYDKLQRASNAVTSLELGLSGYHAFTMANEAVISQVAKGIGQIVGGRIKQGLGSIGTAIAAPISSAVKGHKFEQIYLGKTPGTPDWRRIVDLGTEAGMRAKGNRYATDYRYSAMGSYWTAFKRGALKAEMAQSYGNIKNAPNLPRAVGKAASEGFKQLGRIMETVAQPLFEKYIPKLKNGAFYDTMKSWIEMHPQAGYDEQVAAARQIWDSIDNRFGEMVQDNIFWNKILKQSAQLGMRSYSWNLGTVREIGGGVKDIVQTARGKQEWSPRASYVVAMPIVVATMNATYQYLKTGKMPESVDDLIAGRTGGTDAATGKEERASLPGYQKDVFGWYHDAKQEAANKVATLPRMAGETIANKDWRGDPIVDPNGSMVEQLQQYFTWVQNSIGPISVRQAGKGPKVGSEIGRVEGMTGIRPAGRAATDPEGYERMMQGVGRRQWNAKKRHDRKQDSQYGGYE